MCRLLGQIMFRNALIVYPSVKLAYASHDLLHGSYHLPLVNASALLMNVMDDTDGEMDHDFIDKIVALLF